jgi:hypothetical protein
MTSSPEHNMARVPSSSDALFSNTQTLRLSIARSPKQFRPDRKHGSIKEYFSGLALLRGRELSAALGPTKGENYEIRSQVRGSTTKTARDEVMVFGTY